MSDIKKACDILNSGGVVGMPTETVYGLAGSIQSSQSIENIFKTKERPFFDPLIVHISSIEQAQSLTIEWTESCQKLADNFWPGPLTIILKKSAVVDDMITSGLDTVGVRFPKHPVAKELIETLGHPVAAPSANKFKKVSPTTADHVRAEFPSILVLEGGESEVGIESTIVQLAENELKILRPGMLTRDDFVAVLGSDFKICYTESPIAPGHLKEHYRPNKPLVIRLLDENLEHNFNKINSWVLPSDSVIAARKLYGKLRELDQMDGDSLEVVIEEKFLSDEKFKGILNRLIKAAYLKSTRIKSEY